MSRLFEYLNKINEEIYPPGDPRLQAGATSKEYNTVPQGGAGSGAILLNIHNNTAVVQEGGKTQTMPFEQFKTYTTPNGLKPYEILAANKRDLTPYVSAPDVPGRPADFLISQEGKILRQNQPQQVPQPQQQQQVQQAQGQNPNQPQAVQPVQPQKPQQ